jgi:hypothetical protein
MWREEIIERIQAKYKVLEPVLSQNTTGKAGGLIL